MALGRGSALVSRTMAKPRKAAFGQRRKGVRRPTAKRLVKPSVIKRFTGYGPDSWGGVVPKLKSGRYYLDDRNPGGAAPKDFIWVHPSNKGPVRMGDWPHWPAYIAKVGHQFYPAESVTEQLMTRLGQLLGLRMAHSRLMVCAGQLRFLSQYFLRPEEILNHGADIAASYLTDEAFVKRVADEKAERDLFTFQVFCTAIRARFPGHHEEITREFVRMIGFDALVGNHDRHFYNWGVITHPTGAIQPRFSPIFDTARGLFWNIRETELGKYQNRDSLEGYVSRSRPEIGWDEPDKTRHGALNHFDLVERIATLDAKYMSYLEKLRQKAVASLGSCEGMIDAEFEGMFSAPRRELIKQCLHVRFERFDRIF